MKDIKFTIRLSEREKEALTLHAAAAGKTISRYLLDAALADEKELEKENRDLIFQLRRLGTNLNQSLIILRKSGVNPNTIRVIIDTCEELQKWRTSARKMTDEYFKILHKYYKDFLKLKALDMKNKQLQKQLKERR